MRQTPIIYESILLIMTAYPVTFARLLADTTEMAQYFLLSAKARTLTLAAVLRMTDLQAEATFAAIRWPETDGATICPSAPARPATTAAARTARCGSAARRAARISASRPALYSPTTSCRCRPTSLPS